MKIPINRRVLAAIAAAPLLVATLACGNFGQEDTSGPGAGQPASGAAGKHLVVFEVSGPASADVTYGTGADQSQDNGAALPWRKEVPLSTVPFAMTVVAQSKGTAEITCRITVDGALKKENKSSGQFAVVTCSA